MFHRALLHAHSAARRMLCVHSMQAGRPHGLAHVRSLANEAAPLQPRSYRASKAPTVPLSPVPQAAQAAKPKRGEGALSRQQPAAHKETQTASKAEAYIASLNKEQLLACSSKHHAVRVKAGPGSGKTRVVAARVAWLLREGVPPTDILVITFTNKAAGELKERIADVLGPSAARGVTAGTFHSICGRILRRNVELLNCGLDDSYIIYDTDDQAILAKRVLEEHPEYSGISSTASRNLAKALCGAFSAVKNMKPTTYGANLVSLFTEALKRGEIVFPIVEGVNRNRLREPHRLAELFRSYTRKLRSNNAVDFDDLLGLTVALLSKERGVLRFYNDKFKHVLVDEFQDTNEPQYALSRLLKGNNNLFVVGDPDQAVYSWRGADPSIFLDSFAQQYQGGATHFLNTNFRSGAHILKCAEAVLSHAGMPAMHETLNSGRPVPGIVQHIIVRSEYAEAQEVANQVKKLQAGGHKLADMAVLYRTKFQANVLKKQMAASGVPYVVLGDMSLWERAEIKHAMAYMRMLANPLTDSVALDKVINNPSRGLGDTVLKKLKMAAAGQGKSLPEYLFEDCTEVWMPREDVAAKMQEVERVRHACIQEFYQTKKAGTSTSKSKVLSQDKAKQIIEKMKQPLASLRVAPDPSHLGGTKTALQGLEQLRNLLVFGRSAARYSTKLGDVMAVCLDATGYVLEILNEGKSRADLDVLAAMANNEEAWLIQASAGLPELDVPRFVPSHPAGQQRVGAMARSATIETVEGDFADGYGIDSALSTSNRSSKNTSSAGSDSGVSRQASSGASASTSNRSTNNTSSAGSDSGVSRQASSGVNSGGVSTGNLGQGSGGAAEGMSGNELFGAGMGAAHGDSTTSSGGRDDPGLVTLRMFLEQAALVRDLENNADDQNLDRLSLMTLHASKGLEYDTIFLVGFEDGLCPFERGGDEDGTRLPTDYEEEKRLAYVGATRAKERLFLLSAQYRGRQETTVSRYARELHALPPSVLQLHNKSGSGLSQGFARGSTTAGSSVRSMSSSSSSFSGNSSSNSGIINNSSRGESGASGVGNRRRRGGSSRSSSAVSEAGSGSEVVSSGKTRSRGREGGMRGSQRADGAGVKPANGW